MFSYLLRGSDKRVPILEPVFYYTMSFGSGMTRAPPPLLALKKQVNGGSIMIQDELRALYDQMSDEEKNENSVLKGRFTKYITRRLE